MVTKYEKIVTQDIDHGFSTSSVINPGGGSMVGDQINADSFLFKQSGSTVETRTISDKLMESVSFKDFGATGDSVTDDSDAAYAAPGDYTRYGTAEFDR